MTNPTAAMIVIGDEILSGRTQDANMHHLAQELSQVGIDLVEACIVSDNTDDIVEAVNRLRAKYTHVFTSGGIGPTHDDITADSIAQAFGVSIDVREDARAILASNYPNGIEELNDSRLRMARIPEGASLIENPISKAPGFTLENVHVMAGVPSIFVTMLEGLLPHLSGGEPIISETIRVDLPEGEIAGPLGRVAQKFPDLSIGSYPFNLYGKFGANVVIKGRDAKDVETALSEVATIFEGSVYKSYAFMACSFSNQRDRPTMDHKQFQDWLSGIDHLSPAQRQEAETVFMGVSEASSSLAAIEASVGESRQCPHCGTPGAISRGKARGLRRYQCKGCNKTFNAATGTPLSGLHRKDKWLAFGTCLSDGLTVRASAERCKFAVNTAFRWRHRFLTTDNPKARKLTGIVEVDETYVLQSQKGERNLERKARRRGGKARKRGLSDEQVPVLVAADRSGMTVSAVLPAVNADTLQSAIEPVVDDDIVLVTDGHRAYPPCAAALGVRHEALNLSGGERVRDAFHIQTVNNRHSQLKDFLRRYRGVATRYLDNYLRWFQRLQLENASPRACRATAIADPCIRFVN